MCLLLKTGTVFAAGDLGPLLQLLPLHHRRRLRALRARRLGAARAARAARGGSGAVAGERPGRRLGNGFEAVFRDLELGAEQFFLGGCQLFWCVFLFVGFEHPFFWGGGEGGGGPAVIPIRSGAKASLG